MRHAVFVFLALLGFGLPAEAQLAQGRLTGTVADAQGAVLPGVTVTASSPALIGTQTAITEADGKFLFPSLASGTYTLTFELSGFQTVRRQNIVVTSGRTLTVDVRLPLATLQETVTVTSEAPVVDVTTTSVGSEFSAEKLSAIPSATDIWSTLGQAPGVRMRGFDVGGSHKSQQSGYESFGVRDQNKVVTDGVDTTEGTGGAGFYQDFFAHEEISVSAAGADVSMSTPGSAVFSTIKSGGNEFKSFNIVTYEHESMVGNNIDDATSRRGYTGQPNLIFWEGHTDLGGPIKRDKVWFYTAYNHFKIDKIISGVPQFSEIAGQRLQTTDLGLFDNYTVKGTYKASSKDTFVGYYQWGRKQKPFRGLSASTPPESILAQDSKSWMYNGQWQRVWTNRLFTDVKVGLFGFGWPMAPNVDWKTAPPRTDLATGQNSGAGWLSGSGGGPFTFDRNKPQMSFTMTYYLPEKAGSHDIKLGFEWQDDQSKFGNNGNSGPILYRDRNGLPSEIRVTDVGTFEDFGKGWTGADDRNRWLAVFAQDRWSPSPRLTLTLGVRFDRQEPHYEASVRKPQLSEIFPAATTEGRTLLTASHVSPRVGFSYALSDDAKSVVKGYYGRFYYNFADRLSNVNPGGTNLRDYVFNDLNGNRLFDGVHELGTLLSSSGGSSTALDPNLETPYADEFNVSYERQFWGESSFRAAYVRKMTRNDFTTYVPAREGQYRIATVVPVTLRSFDGGIAGTQNFTLFDVPAGLSTTNIVANVPESVGGSDQNYDTLQFAFTKRFGSGLFFQSSFDYQWRDELRNASNVTTSPLVADPIATGFHQNSQAAALSGAGQPNRQNNTNWTFRALGRYVFRYDIGAAINLRMQSGWPYARVIDARLPNAGTVRFFVEPIENNRSDTVTIVDLRFDKTIRFGRYGVGLQADVFNILNSNAVTNFTLLNGSNFNRITATLDPRTAMVGLRFTF
ncbi:MAG: carboxypeptidase regulatory-like domain-containing protein [Acidobacteriota bacterium]